ncbi:tetratricopeptide repeat protein [Pseudoduganella violaceinigra]|uniref:tetratricopeptide repeat protein n=1 Tax=Pseudoduganella violaceinigra TaxID=246602 RepID=UPI000411B95D|nr:tetratricopeptide repeat protein [Pseudoduganella violaceinigra]
MITKPLTNPFKSSLVLIGALFILVPLYASGQQDLAFTSDEIRFLNALREYQQESKDMPLSDAQFVLASEHEYRGNLNEDRDRAEKLYRLAANAGHSGAQQHLIEAPGSKLDSKRAALWKAQAAKSEKAFRADFLERAKGNDPAAQFAASLILSDVSQQQQSFALLRQSAESGHLEAQLRLAHKYARGMDGIERSAAKSKHWFLKAAEQLRPMAEGGNPLAARMLGDMSSRGEGVPYDRELAAVLFMVAGKQSPWFTEESEELHKVKLELSPDRLARAEGVAAKWQPGQVLPRDMRQATCTSTDFVQPNFDRQRAQAEFANFQTRMRQAVDSITGLDISAANETVALEAIHQAFAPVIASGEKGESLLMAIVQPAPRGIVSPTGVMIEDIMGKACPVGFGGTFTDDGYAVEVWYVDFDPEDRGALKAFKSPELPAHGSLVRGKFPALVFTRTKEGQLQLYGMSQEMSRILSYWWGAQLM